MWHPGIFPAHEFNILSLPHSSADAEIKLSQKAKRKNLLFTNSIVELMHQKNTWIQNNFIRNVVFMMLRVL